MESVKFFDKIQFEGTHKSYSQSLLEAVDGYFPNIGKSVKVISPEDGTAKIEENPASSYFVTALKVLSYATVVIPTLMLIAKLVLRYQYTFQVLTSEEEVPDVEELVMEDTEEEDKAFTAHRPWWNLAGTAHQFLKNNKERGEYNKLIRPFEVYAVEPCVTLVSEGAIKLWNVTLGRFAIDPVSTETLLAATGKIKKWSFTQAKTKPTSLPRIQYFHRCWIVANRYLFTVTRDLHETLKAPATARKTVDTIFVAAKEEIVEKMASDARFAVQSTEEGETQGWIGWLGSRVKEQLIVAGEYGAGIALDKLKETANDTIKEKEKKVRQLAVGAGAGWAAREALSFSTRWGMRALIVGGAVAGGSYLAPTVIPLLGEANVALVTQTLPWLNANVVKVAGIALWARCLKPTMDRLYETHLDDFVEEKSVFASLGDLVDYKGYAKSLSSKIKSTFGESSYIGNFQARVEGELALA